MDNHSDKTPPSTVANGDDNLCRTLEFSLFHSRGDHRLCSPSSLFPSIPVREMNEWPWGNVPFFTSSVWIDSVGGNPGLFGHPSLPTVRRNAPAKLLTLHPQLVIKLWARGFQKQSVRAKGPDIGSRPPALDHVTMHMSKLAPIDPLSPGCHVHSIA